MAYNDSLYIETDESAEQIARTLLSQMVDDLNPEFAEYDDKGYGIFYIGQNGFIISSSDYNPAPFMKKANMKDYGFQPNIHITISYKRGIQDYIPFQTTIVKSVIQLIRETNVNIAFTLEGSCVSKLINSYGDIRISNISHGEIRPYKVFWTDDRLTLLNGLDYEVIHEENDDQ